MKKINDLLKFHHYIHNSHLFYIFYFLYDYVHYFTYVLYFLYNYISVFYSCCSHDFYFLFHIKTTQFHDYDLLLNY